MAKLFVPFCSTQNGESTDMNCLVFWTHCKNSQIWMKLVEDYLLFFIDSNIDIVKMCSWFWVKWQFISLYHVWLLNYSFIVSTKIQLSMDYHSTMLQLCFQQKININMPLRPDHIICLSLQVKRWCNGAFFPWLSFLAKVAIPIYARCNLCTCIQQLNFKEHYYKDSSFEPLDMRQYI